MEGGVSAACTNNTHQDYEDLEVLLSEMPKTPSDSLSSPFFKPSINSIGGFQINLPDEESLATAFADVSLIRDHIGSNGGTSSGAASNGGLIYDNGSAAVACDSYSSYSSPVVKFNSPVYERSSNNNNNNNSNNNNKVCNFPVYTYNGRKVEVPVDHLYSSQYQRMSNLSGMITVDELAPKLQSPKLTNLQNLRERYWRNALPDYSEMYNNSELLYGERLRNPLLFNQGFGGIVATPRPHEVCPQRIVDLAKDQSGCLFLQNVLKEGTPIEVAEVFNEIIGSIVELMIDPFGNYLVQMLLERCNEAQKTLVVYAITRVPGQLIDISCDMHGTRAVQKVIETIKRSPNLVSRVIASLNPGILNLMMDANGSHVTQRCLQHMDPEYTMFILEIALRHCFELAKNRQGCCVLQKCIHHSPETVKTQLVHSITANTLILAEDPYGNYVIQYIIEMKVGWMTSRIVNQLDGRFGALSLQKYSSNVVEKCLKLGGDASRARIVHELMTNTDHLLDVALDQFGNYVLQSAITSSKGAIRAALVEAIRPHAPALRNSSYGRRVLARMGMKNK